MSRTYTDQALHIVERQLTVSRTDGNVACNRGIQFRPNGYIFAGNKRISKSYAVTTLAGLLEAEAQSLIPKKAKSSSITWDKLNQATKDFFFDLASEIYACSPDVCFENNQPPAARLGHDIKIGLKNAPRLSNLKKAGMMETTTWNANTKTERYLCLTEQGLATYRAMHAGCSLK
jgi:hypothetical protein|tara:strand:+ start:97 stop:621 length:525 start_codon:yes stop_codon:yes gene_type:complete